MHDRICPLIWYQMTIFSGLAHGLFYSLFAGSLLPTSNPSPILEDESTKCSIGWVIAVVVQGVINAILTAIVVFGFMRWRQATNNGTLE